MLVQFPLLSSLAPDRRHNFRCPVCHKFVTRNGHKLGQICKSPKANPGLACPRCNSTETIKSGLNIWKIQVWRCKQCLRCWREEILPREDYEFHMGKTKIIIGFGICLRCHKKNRDLGNGLCLTCFDNADNAGAQYYWRQKARNRCVRCENIVSSQCFCDIHREKERIWRMKRKIG